MYEVTLLCPTICLLQVLHFSKITETQRRAAKDRVSHSAPDLEDQVPKKGHGLNWECQTEWKPTVRILSEAVDGGRSFHVTCVLHLLVILRGSSVCFTVRGALKPRGFRLSSVVEE